MNDLATVFESVRGATVVAVDTDASARWSDDLVHIVTDKGVLRFIHYGQCCESVDLEDVAGGDLADLVGERIEEIREDSSQDGDPRPREQSESWTWTFYTIRTNRLTLTLRFLGESNGCYSESVDFIEIE